MYNLPEAPDSRRTKGENGIHLWRYGGHPRDVRALKNIDVAFVCMNLPYTMDIEQASSAVLELKPRSSIHTVIADKADLTVLKDLKS